MNVYVVDTRNPECWIVVDCFNCIEAARIAIDGLRRINPKRAKYYRIAELENDSDLYDF